MKRFLFAVAVVALSAVVVSAEDKPVAPAKPATPPATTAPATGTPVVEYSTTDAPRRGLFSRLRSGNGLFGRRTTSSYTPAPTTVTPPAATPMPMPGTTPTPMPPVKPATGTLPAGRYTTTDGTIVQVGGTTTSGSRVGNRAEPTRDSFLSRLRAR